MTRIPAARADCQAGRRIFDGDRGLRGDSKLLERQHVGFGRRLDRRHILLADDRLEAIVHAGGTQDRSMFSRQVPETTASLALSLSKRISSTTPG